MTIITRRTTLGLMAGSAVALTRPAWSDPLALRGDDGKPLENLRIPSELAVATLPGIVWTGAEKADVTLVEFFDYNCTWCRKAVGDLDAQLARDKSFRLGLMNYAVFGIGSIQAAKVQQAVLKLGGPEKAYAYHRAMFGGRGRNDGTTALAAATALGLDKAAIEEAADSKEVTGVLTRQTKLAEAIGFNATPSFAMNGFGFAGYPGPKSVGDMVKAVRKCERPVCG